MGPIFSHASNICKRIVWTTRNSNLSVTVHLMLEEIVVWSDVAIECYRVRNLMDPYRTLVSDVHGYLMNAVQVVADDHGMPQVDIWKQEKSFAEA